MPVRAAVRPGIIAGLAMIPLAVVFRAFGLRINEYGRKTLALLVGRVDARAEYPLLLIEHLLISWLVAIPLVLVLRGVRDPSRRVLAGAGYGVAFYVVVNALALPMAFGDRSPWLLGVDTVWPSLVGHVLYGVVVAVAAPRVDRAHGVARATG